MSVAYLLSRNHKVTIVAKDLPGDERTFGWASPWAGVSFIAGGCDNRREMQMQLDAFAELWRMSIRNPESSIKHMTINEVYNEVKTEDDIWWKDYVPEVSRQIIEVELDLQSNFPSVSILERIRIARRNQEWHRM